MIRYTQGNLLNATTEALVNTVNTVGVMGKGIALQFKNRFPHNYKIYKDACNAGTFKTGQILAVKDGDLMDQKWILNFPTKAHWKGNSKYEYIDDGLVALKDVLLEKNIKSVAIPPLGCGNGGLDWVKVKESIEATLKSLPIDIVIYTPNNQIKEILQNEETKREAKLTPARAMLLYLLFQYESRGEQSSLFVANKLAYFLQRSGEPLRLNFEAHHYGPYAVQLNHVFQYLNGVYLKGLEQNKAGAFEPLHLNYEKLSEIKQYINNRLSDDQRKRLHHVVELVNGFESSFSLELLSSVDYLYANQQLKSVEDIIGGLSDWNIRKSDLFKPQHVKIAFHQLQQYASSMF